MIRFIKPPAGGFFLWQAGPDRHDILLQCCFFKMIFFLVLFEIPFELIVLLAHQAFDVLVGVEGFVLQLDHGHRNVGAVVGNTFDIPDQVIEYKAVLTGIDAALEPVYLPVLHIRRRRWKDAGGKSVSKDWQMVAKGTRYSKEFATFLKEFLGYIPDYGQIAPETISRKG